MLYGKATDCRLGLEKGDIFISFPNQIHYYESFGPEEYQIFYINPEIVPQFMSLFETNVPKSSHIKADKVSPKLSMLLDGILETSDEIRRGEKYAEEMRSGYVLAFFSELLRSMELYGPDTGELSALKNIVDYCSRNYTKEISLETLSKELHISKYYISHIFGSRLNVRFNDYINSLRISKACLLLTDSDMSITAISDRVGFSTIRTFNRAFLRQTGKSPSEYRRTITNAQKLSVTGGPVTNYVMGRVRRSFSASPSPPAPRIITTCPRRPRFKESSRRSTFRAAVSTRTQASYREARSGNSLKAEALGQL